jgi:hypothetical protein
MERRRENMEKGVSPIESANRMFLVVSLWYAAHAATAALRFATTQGLAGKDDSVEVQEA